MPKKYLWYAAWTTLFLITGIAFNNCSKPIGKSAPPSGPDPFQNINAETCEVPSLQQLSGSLGSLSFNRQKLQMGSELNQDYVSLVSKGCLENPETRARSNFTQRMGLRNMNNPEEVLVQKIESSQLSVRMSSLRDEIENDPCVIGVSPNRIYRRNLVIEDFDDEFLELLGHLDFLDFTESLLTFYDPALGISDTTLNPVKVAVIDTGAHYDHEDLVDNIYVGPNGIGVDATTLGQADVDPVYDGRDIDDLISHGTHVSGIIAARGANGLGVTGLAPQGVKIIPINVFFPNLDPDAPEGEVVSDSATLIRGLQFAVSEGADVINLSLGGGGADPALFAALQAAVSSGVFIAAAAANDGNELGDDFQAYPAFYANQISGMVSVASVDSATGERSFFSNYSSTYVEIAAPGSESQIGTVTRGIGSTGRLNDEDDYIRLFGTSQACPMVSAAAALAKALLRENGYEVTASQLETLILASAVKDEALEAEVRSGNVLNLHRLAAYINRNFPGTGQLASNALCASPE